MSKFKPGDLVTPISVDFYETFDERSVLFGKVLIVVNVLPDEEGVSVLAGIIEDKKWYWRSDDLVLLYADQPEHAPEPTDPAPAQKPLRRGDLVMHRGQIGVVHEIDPDGDDGYWVALLTGDGGCVCRGADDLTRIGSIRKKVKRLRQQMEGGK